MRLLRHSSRLAVLAVAATFACVTTTTGAAAIPRQPPTSDQAASPTGGSFYDPPSPLPPGKNGDIIRHEASQFYLDPLKTIPAKADVQRIMYRSTDTHGDPTAVTGTVLTPHEKWSGKGERPLVSYAMGTQGVADKCAPSKAMASGLEYEGLFIKQLLKRGYGVVASDYEGLGTPGEHTYVNRASEGHAILDALRAAQRLPEAKLPDHGPVATSGYSQGGGASASAAELQPSYASELDLKGSYAGAAPADLDKVAESLDGSHAAGFLGFALVGMDAAYPKLDIPGVLNKKGKETFEEIKGECVLDVVKHAFMKSTDLTKDGRPLSDYLSEEPYKSRVDEQRIGERQPTAPTLVIHSKLDDIVPYEQGRQMARSWCAKGANVHFTTYYSPTHVATAAASFPEAMSFLKDRFAEKPQQDNCGDF